MLDEMEKTISMAELVRDPTAIAQRVETEAALFRVKRRGHNDMILMDEGYMENWIALIQLSVQHPNWRELFEQQMKELDAGGGRDLRDVMRDAGHEAAYDRAVRRAARDAAKPRVKKSRRITRASRNRPATRSAAR